MSGGQTTDASADHHAIEGLSGRLRVFELPGVQRIANAVARGHYGMGISVCCGVISYATVTIPVLLGHHGWCARRAGERTPVKEICTGHLRIHTECAIRLRALRFLRRKFHLV